MRAFGSLWERDSAQAKILIRQTGYVMGAELLAHGIDFSFAPVLDLDYGESSVIGDRSLHRDPAIVTALARELVAGFAEAGMSWVGKHFPGHGYVRADSHHELPVDARTFAEIENDDLVPFRDFAQIGMGGIMPAHVIYSEVDSVPAGFSAIWLKDILRQRLGFQGIIFSDDLSMEAAGAAGGVVDRARAAIDAGCDMILLCNDSAKADELIFGLEQEPQVVLAPRFDAMRASAGGEAFALSDNARYRAALSALQDAKFA